jgi:hypothetical protein
MRHVLGVLGIVAAGVLLAVSAAMNWRFGFSIGKTELDGQIYGAASAAADCFKALVPFFFFAAIKNRMWSQAAASAVVWVVVTAYSLTSALGHAALNRQDTTGQRAVQAQSYKDLRGELKRAEDQISWIPQHRPALTVAGDIANLKNQREFGWTKGCTEVTGKSNRDFCQKVHGLGSELASAQQAEMLSRQISQLREKIHAIDTVAVNSEADPQAAVLAKLGHFVGFTSMKVEDVQTALTIFIALLLEVGSGFGMYVAFSQWRLYDQAAPRAPQIVTAVATPVAASVASAPAPTSVLIAQQPAAIANDNRSVPMQKLVAPDDDVERYRKERIDNAEGSSLTATELYMDYCAWCEEQQKEPLALPTFGRELGELGVPKAKIAGRVRYIGIALRAETQTDEEKRPPGSIVQAA